MAIPPSTDTSSNSNLAAALSAGTFNIGDANVQNTKQTRQVQQKFVTILSQNQSLVQTQQSSAPSIPEPVGTSLGDLKKGIGIFASGNSINIAEIVALVLQLTSQESLELSKEFQLQSVANQLQYAAGVAQADAAYSAGVAAAAGAFTGAGLSLAALGFEAVGGLKGAYSSFKAGQAYDAQFKSSASLEKENSKTFSETSEGIELQPLSSNNTTRSTSSASARGLQTDLQENQQVQGQETAANETKTGNLTESSAQRSQASVERTLNTQRQNVAQEISSDSSQANTQNQPVRSSASNEPQERGISSDFSSERTFNEPQVEGPVTEIEKQDLGASSSFGSDELSLNENSATRSEGNSTSRVSGAPRNLESSGEIENEQISDTRTNRNSPQSDSAISESELPASNKTAGRSTVRFGSEEDPLSENYVSQSEGDSNSRVAGSSRNLDSSSEVEPSQDLSSRQANSASRSASPASGTENSPVSQSDHADSTRSRNTSESRTTESDFNESRQDPLSRSTDRPVVTQSQNTRTNQTTETNEGYTPEGKVTETAEGRSSDIRSAQRTTDPDSNPRVGDSEENRSVEGSKSKKASEPTELEKLVKELRQAVKKDPEQYSPVTRQQIRNAAFDRAKLPFQVASHALNAVGQIGQGIGQQQQAVFLKQQLIQQANAQLNASTSQAATQTVQQLQEVINNARNLVNGLLQSEFSVSRSA